MAQHSRRKFLKCALCGAGALAANALTPRFLMAQSAGTGKNAIFINLAGGHDDKFMFPYTGSLASAIQAKRPTLAISPSIALPLNGEIGLHPNWGAVFQSFHLSDAALKLIPMAGIPNNTFSHNDDANIMSRGIIHPQTQSQQTGFLGRLMSSYNMTQYQVMGLASGSRLDFYGSTSASPLVMGKLSGFKRAVRSGTAAAGTPDGVFASQIAEQLANLNISANPKEDAVRLTLRNAYSAVTQVAQYNQVAPTGSYPAVPIGAAMSDAVRVFRGKRLQGDLSNTIIYTTFGGFDTHGTEAQVLPGKITDLAGALTALVSDLKAFNLFSDTVIYIFSEFGRTNHENGGQGTDHGSASTHLVLGGSVRGGNSMVAGPMPTSADISQRSQTPVNVDFRNVYAEIFQWMGYDPSLVFTESYSRVALNLLG